MKKNKKHHTQHLLEPKKSWFEELMPPLAVFGLFFLMELLSGKNLFLDSLPKQEEEKEPH